MQGSTSAVLTMRMEMKTVRGRQHSHKLLLCHSLRQYHPMKMLTMETLFTWHVLCMATLNQRSPGPETTKSLMLPPLLSRQPLLQSTMQTLPNLFLEYVDFRLQILASTSVMVLACWGTQLAT